MSYSPFRHLGAVLWKRRPLHLTFFLTRRCNSRCPFCFYLSGGAPAAGPSAELKLSEIARISAGLPKLLWLAFSGGEIFLRPELAEITSIFYRRNRPAIILLPTNGLLTATIAEKTEEILKGCPKSTVVVKLSLDGGEQLHDRLRGRAGAWRQTLATAEALGKLLSRYPNFELGINSVFCSANQDEMPELIDFVARLKHIRTHTISLIRGEVGEAGLKEVDLEKYRKACEKLAENLRSRIGSCYHFRGAAIKAAQDNLQRRLIYETRQRQQQLLPCYAGRLNLVLTESGDLYPCESFTGCFGNLRECGYDINRLLRSEAARTALAAIRKGCFCTHECYMMTNILFNPAQYPALLKEYLRLRVSSRPGAKHRRAGRGTD